MRLNTVCLAGAALLSLAAPAAALADPWDHDGWRREAWREHEWRKAGWDPAGVLDPERDWSGEGDIAGKRVFVYGEQGLGDILQFVRYVPLLADGGARITLAVQAPLVGLRAGRYKLTLCEKDPPMLFDIDADPKELTNLAGDPAHAETLSRLTAQAQERWNLASFDAAVRESQARRWVVYTALRNGAYYPWDYQPLQKASERYMRNHMDLNVLEENQRFPRGE